MNRQQPDLLPGDEIAIKYRLWQSHGSEDAIVDRWVRAVIVEAAADTRPLARLSDGQMTEIRGYMIWRYVARASQSNMRRIAA